MVFMIYGLRVKAYRAMLGTPVLFFHSVVVVKTSVQSIELNQTAKTRFPIVLVGPVAKRLKKSVLKDDLEEGNN